MTSFIHRTLALVTLSAASLTAHATLVDLGAGSVPGDAASITFSERPLGTINPVYSLTGLPVVGSLTVSFAGTFVGQTVTGTTFRSVTGAPSGPLTLDTSVPVFTTDDSAPGATSPVLSGAPRFTGPVSVLFSKPVNAVGFKIGYLDALGATTMEAFSADGSSLGSVTNSNTGFQMYGLAEQLLSNSISGLTFSISPAETFGFAIDNLTFSAGIDLNATTPAVPEPSVFVLALVGMGVLVASRRRS